MFVGATSVFHSGVGWPLPPAEHPSCLREKQQQAALSGDRSEEKEIDAIDGPDGTMPCRLIACQ
jgi:hypothetical protein